MGDDSQLTRLIVPAISEPRNQISRTPTSDPAVFTVPANFFDPIFPGDPGKPQVSKPTKRPDTPENQDSQADTSVGDALRKTAVEGATFNKTASLEQAQVREDTASFDAGYAQERGTLCDSSHVHDKIEPGITWLWRFFFKQVFQEDHNTHLCAESPNNCESQIVTCPHVALRFARHISK